MARNVLLLKWNLLNLLQTKYEYMLLEWQRTGNQFRFEEKEHKKEKQKGDSLWEDIRKLGTDTLIVTYEMMEKEWIETNLEKDFSIVSLKEFCDLIIGDMGYFSMDKYRKKLGIDSQKDKVSTMKEIYVYLIQNWEKLIDIHKEKMIDTLKGDAKRYSQKNQDKILDCIKPIAFETYESLENQVRKDLMEIGESFSKNDFIQKNEMSIYKVRTLGRSVYLDKVTVHRKVLSSSLINSRMYTLPLAYYLLCPGIQNLESCT